MSLGVVTLYSLWPLLWQLLTSLKPEAELTTLPPLLPARWTWEHYRIVFAQSPFPRLVLNSALVASLSTILTLLVGATAGMALSQVRIPARKPILALVLSVSMFPPIAIVSPLYILIRALGLRDTPWALILLHTTFSLPLAIWILTNFFDKIPREIYAAAQVDGCSPLQALIHAVLPLAAPGVFTAAIFVFIYSWNEFLFALTFSATARSRTVPVGIALFPGVQEVPWGDIAAATIVAIVPLLVLAALCQRRIVEGLTAGAVKG
ncbi:MAG: carbohydrate ABC transporter permease [Candidatus Tectomicrobia bacterium]|uniref:Carbohydrate ABC transporter permease n=1 Tax=Tectimicrobiota bacterium TaxID=2528274 RepID=A0A932M0S3_UNCTE|nr:carbohydrate ABC transporter permease [Candidatus Tectomicrobia bacterium]